MLYLDTSLVVTLLTSEAETAKAQFWMRQQPPGQLAISDWVVTEFYAALSMKVRLRFLTPQKREAAQGWFESFARETFGLLKISSADFMSAARFAERSASGLRGGDALHLALASSKSATLCTRDKSQAKAGLEFGIKTLLI